MPRRKPPCALLAALIIAAASVAHCQAAAQPVAQPPAGRTADQQRQVNRLVGLFRLAHREPQKRAAIVAEATRLGRPAVAALYAAITREMYPLMKSYRNKFNQQAATLAKNKLSRVDPAEVERLRLAVLELKDGPNFTKQAILRQADPAMARLAEIFLIDRSTVLARSKPLQTQRTQLTGLGTYWEQCGRYLYKLMPNDQNKPKDRPDFEQYLQGEEQLAIGMAAPMEPRTLQVLVENTRLAAQLEPEEARGILSLNLMRNLLGIAPLAIDPKLCAAARDHCRDMRELKFFDHTSPVEGKTTPWDRAERLGTKASAENIYHGAHDGRVANQAWFHSPGHHKNMLGKYTRVGLGRSGAYFTLMFGR